LCHECAIFVMANNQTLLIIVAIVVIGAIGGGYLLLSQPKTPVDVTPPVADAGDDIELFEGEEFSLDASGSEDDVEIAGYIWKHDEMQIGTEVEFKYSFEEMGEYHIILIVTDSSGNASEDTVKVTVIMEETPEPEPEPTPMPTVDGVVEEEEYTNRIVESRTGIVINWNNNETDLFIALESQGKGWVAIGIDPENAMKGANFIFGYVKEDETFVSDQYGSALFNHSPDISGGGSEDIIEYKGTEDQEKTVFEFRILLDSRDTRDKTLEPGGEYKAIVAYQNSSDNFTTKHSKRGSIQLKLD